MRSVTAARELVYRFIDLIHGTNSQAGRFQWIRENLSAAAARLDGFDSIVRRIPISTPLALILIAACIFFGLRVLRVVSIVAISGIAAVRAWHMVYLIGTINGTNITFPTAITTSIVIGAFYMLICLAQRTTGATMVRLFAGTIAPLAAVIAFPDIPHSTPILLLIAAAAFAAPPSVLFLCSTAIAALAFSLALISSLIAAFVAGALVHIFIQGRWFRAIPQAP